MAQSQRLPSQTDLDATSAAAPYTAFGHPSIEHLLAEQGTGPITDASELHGNFWPEDESVEEFVATIRRWRGHGRTVPPE